MIISPQTSEQTKKYTFYVIWKSKRIEMKVKIKALKKPISDDSNSQVEKASCYVTKLDPPFGTVEKFGNKYSFPSFKKTPDCQDVEIKYTVKNLPPFVRKLNLKNRVFRIKMKGL